MKLYVHYIILLTALLSCKSSIDKNRPGKSVEIRAEDSSKLIHIKDQFYKSDKGHLYELTWANKDEPGADTLAWFKYFNGQIPQDMDPFSFKELNGWYAKDKNYAYVHRPTSGGLVLAKLDEADVKTFDIFQEHYNYAADKNHIYHEGELLEGIDPKNVKVVTDDKGFVIKLISGKTVYIP